MSAAKVELGRVLFSDTRLSINNTTSCATCHLPSRHFTDGRNTALGATGAQHPRNTPTLLNVAYNASFNWTDQGIHTLEAQHVGVLTNTDPVEMGFTVSRVDTLMADPALRRLHLAAFDSEAASMVTISRALASYVRTLLRADRPFDRYLYWDERNALTDEARQGLTLFFSERFKCSTCHAGRHLSGPTHDGEHKAQPAFHATGVSASEGAFRAPSLRFVPLTAPSMHDGSTESLEEVIAFYARGEADDLTPIEMGVGEAAALAEFLKAL